MSRKLPPLIHLRAPQPRGAGRPSSPPPSSEDLSARAAPVDVVRRELQSGALPRDTEVLFTGIVDWTPASEVPELWIAPVDAPPADAGDAADSVDSHPASSSKNVAPKAGSKKKGVSALAIIGAIFGAIGLLLIGAGAIYLVYFHYTPVAIRHLPKKCTVAGRVDFIDWVFFSPFKDKLVPAIEEATKPKPGGPPGPEGPSLKERILASAGINLDRDAREVAFCVYQDTTPSAAGAPPDVLHGVRFVVAIGGRLKRGAIPGLYEAIRTESFASIFRLDGVGDTAVLRMTSPFPGVIGQADDGTIIFAPNDAVLAELRQPMTEDEAEDKTRLKKLGGLELSASHLVFALFSTISPTAALDAATIDAISRVQTGHFSLVLSKQPYLALDVDHRTDAEAKATEAALRHLLDLVQTELSASSTDWAGEHGAIAGAKLVRTDTSVSLRLDFPYSDVDRGATTFGEQLKDEKSPFRTKTLPLLLYSAGVGPAPPASASASGSSSAPPGGSGSAPPSPSPSIMPMPE